MAGDSYGSTVLTFTPHSLHGGEFSFDIGTAGGVTLVLQTMMPPLLHAPKPSRVTLTGGSHVPFCPSVDYLAKVFVPMLLQLGAELYLRMDRYGGGKICAEIVPVRKLRRLVVDSRGELGRVTGRSGVCNLPLDIAERQRSAALAVINEGGRHLCRLDDIELVDVPGPGRGTFIFLEAVMANIRVDFTSLGAIGKRAETVGEEVAADLGLYLSTGAALDAYLPDQLIPYLAFSREESSFTTAAITRHLLTNLWVVNLFMPLRFHIEGEEGLPGRVTISPS